MLFIGRGRGFLGVRAKRGRAARAATELGLSSSPDRTRREVGDDGWGHPSVRQREGRAVWVAGPAGEKKTWAPIKKKGERLGWAGGGKRKEKRKLGRAGKGERGKKSGLG